MSLTKNIKFNEAETWVIDATFHDSTGEALDITGATEIEWSVATRPGVAAIVEAAMTTDHIVITDGEAGTATITVEYADHSDATPGHYLHECRVTLESGEVTVQFKGKLHVEDSIFVV